MREKKFSKSPWSSCHEGKCQCKQVWSKTDDHPVAKVDSGNVGDDYPYIKDGIAVMEQITYWNIKEDTATANAQLISAAPELLEALEALDAADRLYDINHESSIAKMVKAAIAKAYGE